MRGVYLPAAGTHTVEFRFRLSNKPIYVTFSALGVAFLLAGFLFYAGRRNSGPAAQP